MFESARLKLTAWYLCIIMAISILFSLAAYQTSVAEIRRGMRGQAMMNSLGRKAVPGMMKPGTMIAPGDEYLYFSDLDAELFAQASRRIALQLVVINVGILMLSGAAGYILAGRTLRPIEEMVEDQRRFVADASHELRTPLTAMRTETEVALRDENLSTDDARNVLESGLEEIAKLQSLSDYLLTLGHLEKLDAQAPFARVNLAQVLEEAARRVEILAKEKDIAIDVRSDGAVIEGLKDHLVQLTVILLDNAIKYSPSGSSVAVGTRTLKSRVVLTVEDKGAGIRAGDLPYIFNRFYRADTSRTKDGAHGYGLGLSIAKSIIDLHDGKVTVDSAPGKGTTFTISLPSARNVVKAAAAGDYLETTMQAIRDFFTTGTRAKKA
ncbi:MAG: sensor histidine kinase [Candidatus Aquicultorales bacterium]